MYSKFKCLGLAVYCATQYVNNSAAE